MKFLLPLLAAIAVCTASVSEDPTAGYKEGDRFFFFPGDDDNTYHLVDTEEPVDYNFIDEYLRNPDNNQYWLFTRENPTKHQVLSVDNATSIHSSNFCSSKNTIFLVHGWNGNGGNTMNKLLTKAFLEDSDVNVIVLDWNRLANRNYVTARNGVAAVGEELGRFAVWLTTFGLSLDRVHLVGFSLGGHLVGNAGKATGGLVARITALDPAGPLYRTNHPDRVMSTDAQYVEVIHTNTAFLGYADLCGDADFYPNGGSSMPGCFLNSCSHSMSYEYMASSVTHNRLNANECDSKRDAERDRCIGSLNPMGNSNLDKSTPGIFRVNTARRYPY